MRFNYLSPDGFPISPTDFATKEAADSYLAEWIKRYEAQGYYSSNSGRISLDILASCCELDVTEGLSPYELRDFAEPDAYFIITDTDDGNVIGLVKNGDAPEEGVLAAVSGYLDQDVRYDEGTAFTEDPHTGNLTIPLLFGDQETITICITSKIPY
jgi:hypothetical protein